MKKPSPEAVEELLSRSISYIFPSKEAFGRALRKGERLRIYLGADATGPDLHLGHATNIIFLEKLRRLGHEVIFLFGDFTARIGDPTGKESARKRLTEAEVEKNITGWKSQAAKILAIDDNENPAQILKNSAWLSKMTLDKVLELATHVTAQQMLERDMFEERYKSRKPIYLHEFLYPLMQGYDSVAMNVDAEVGGNDQLFNMMMGRDLQKEYNNTNKFVIATTLLENPNTGKKLMSKSEGSYIALSDSPREMYGKAMALPDEVIFDIFTHCTFLPMKKITEYRELMNKDKINPRDMKMKMAREVVKTYHSEAAADKAEKEFVETFQKKEIPEDAREIDAHEGDILGKLLVNTGVLKSNAEFRRLVAAGAVKNMDTGEKVEDHTELIHLPLHHSATYKIGKKQFVKIKRIK